MSAVTVFIAFVSACFYVLATLIMKLYGASAFFLALPVACLALIAAAAFEIEILKDSNMARVFILILAFEIIATLLCAMIFTSDTLGWREGVGALLLLAGVFVMSGGPATHALDAPIAAKQARLGAMVGR